MLIIGLIVACCLYVVLYWLFVAASQNNTAVSFLTLLNEMFVMPESEIFVLLRGLLIITLFYVVADALLAPARRGLQKRRQRRLDAEREKEAFRGYKKSAPASDDDDEEDDSYKNGSTVDSNFAPPRYSA